MSSSTAIAGRNELCFTLPVSILSIVCCDVPTRRASSGWLQPLLARALFTTAAMSVGSIIMVPRPFCRICSGLHLQVLIYSTLYGGCGKPGSWLTWCAAAEYRCGHDGYRTHQA